jgi:hypothetical protein
MALIIFPPDNPVRPPHYCNKQTTVTPCSRLLLEKLIVRLGSQKIPHHLWNPKVLGPQEPATGSYSEPDQSNQHSSSIFRFSSFQSIRPRPCVTFSNMGAVSPTAQSPSWRLPLVGCTRLIIRYHIIVLN